MKKITVFLFLVCYTIIGAAQSNLEKFQKLFKENDTVKIKSLLSQWEKDNPNDPEFYASAFNFYFSGSKHEFISLSNKQTKQSFQLKDSTGKVAGYVGSDIDYDLQKRDKAFAYINTGINKFPDRLDLRFGKCYALQTIEDYENFTTEVIKAIEYSNTIKNNWRWTGNKKTDDAEHFFVSAIQTYLKELYDTEDDNLLPYMKRIGDVALKYYPDNVEILSTTAVANMLTKEYDKALVYLKHAETINPKDFIVLNNIAQGYKLKGDKQNAIKYFELTAKYGDEEAKQQAADQIRQLKK
jgi:tetratricopeptide (TPR) repeat protein